MTEAKPLTAGLKIVLGFLILFSIFAIAMFIWGRSFIPILDSFY